MRTLITLFFMMTMGALMAKNESLEVSAYLKPAIQKSGTTAQIYGYVEKVTLVDKNITLPAKLDTGAKSASLNATNITEIEVNGVPYIRFTLPTKDGDRIFECEYIGKVKIKVRANEANPTAGKATPIKRPVVLLNMQLGDKVRAVQVNLTNRKRFLYPLLLGRDAIIDFNGAVDPSLAYTLKSKGSRHS